MLEDFDKIFEELILKGAVEISALDEHGNPLYSFTDKIHNVAPEIAERMNEAFHHEIMVLWEKGFLSMDVTSNNPVVSITEVAFDSEKIAELSYDQQVTLKIIKDAMRK